MLGELPEGWNQARLGSLISEHHDRVGTREDLPALSLTKHNGLVLALERFGRALHNKDVARYRHVVRDDIVVDPMLLWDGAVARLTAFDEGFVSPDYRIFRANLDIVDLGFLGHWLRGPQARSAFENGARGTNIRRNRIGRSDFVQVDVSLPPLPEQKKIAAILSSVDEAIEATQAVIDQTRRVKDGVLRELLMRGAYGANVPPRRLVPPPRWVVGKLSEVTSIPEDWQLVRICDVARLESGHTPSRKVPSYWDGEIQWLSLHDTKRLEEHVISRTTRTITEDGVANSSARFLPAGTVAFSRTATVGKCVILGERMTTSQDFACYVCGPRLHNKFLLHLFRYMQHVWSALSGGSTHQTVYMPVFETLQILLPPLPEQVRIAEIMDRHDLDLAANSRNLVSLRQTKSALLTDLLTGKVRVTP